MKKIQMILLFSFFIDLVNADEVNVYTSRHYDSDDALYEEFTEETGIKAVSYTHLTLPTTPYV